MNPMDISQTVVQQLETAWNAADGAAFGAPFTPEASFVTVRGELHAGEAIATGENSALATIVLVRDGGHHRIAAFHNTLIAAS